MQACIRINPFPCELGGLADSHLHWTCGLQQDTNITPTWISPLCVQISGNHRVSENNEEQERIKAAGGEIAQVEYTRLGGAMGRLGA